MKNFGLTPAPSHRSRSIAILPAPKAPRHDAVKVPPHARVYQRRVVDGVEPGRVAVLLVPPVRAAAAAQDHRPVRPRHQVVGIAGRVEQITRVGQMGLVRLFQGHQDRVLPSERDDDALVLRQHRRGVGVGSVDDLLGLGHAPGSREKDGAVFGLARLDGGFCVQECAQLDDSLQ